jgi:hypothetical protein
LHCMLVNDTLIVAKSTLKPYDPHGCLLLLMQSGFTEQSVLQITGQSNLQSIQVGWGRCIDPDLRQPWVQ